MARADDAAAAPAVRAAAAVLPGEPGVYRFRDDRGRTLYVGRAVDLRRRVLSYWGDLRDRPHLRRMVPRIARVEAVVCDSGHEAAWLERNLLEHRKPYWNRTRGGQEVPVYLRLDARGLAIVHELRVSGGRPARGDAADVASVRPAYGRPGGPPRARDDAGRHRIGDDVRVYSRPLSASEIQADMAAGV